MPETMRAIFYFDAKGEPCEKQDAVSAIIKETDMRGNVVRETWLDLPDGG